MAGAGEGGLRVRDHLLLSLLLALLPQLIRSTSSKAVQRMFREVGRIGIMKVRTDNVSARDQQ